jgi:serine phosphatase RsbU (regulator of sigma subunit)
MSLNIKSKLLFSFSIICLFSLMIAIASAWLYKERSDISKQVNRLNEIHLLSLESYKLQQAFLINESSNLAFYKYGNSPILDKHNIISLQIMNLLAKLNENKISKKLFDVDYIQEIHNEQVKYQKIFKEVVGEMMVKGFKDYGCEGKMRDYAHALMTNKWIDQTSVLMLRRHEKDFIIRKDTKYIVEFNKVIQTLKDQVNGDLSLNEIQKVNVRSTLDDYRLSFTQLTKVYTKLYGKNNDGLINDLFLQHDVIVSKIAFQKQSAFEIEKLLLHRLLIWSSIIIISLLILSFFLSYKFSVYLSKPIIKLNESIKAYVDSKFKLHSPMEERVIKDEIYELSHSYSKMVDEISNHIKHFEEKVEQRTEEVNKQSDEILSQKIKIFRQYNELQTKNNELQTQQKLVMERNKNILDSISYAERIQRSLLPSIEPLINNLSDGFIYFQPRDIVSGDFYFATKKGDKIFFAVADCTGHGVPGAFVSIIAMHAIHRALNEFHLTKPSDILNKVNNLVVESISNNKDTIIDDGMDIAFCTLDINTKTLEYSGAHMPIWIMQEQEYTKELSEIQNTNALPAKTRKSLRILTEVKADSQPIGHFMKRIPFTNHSYQLTKGDRIYIFTDGYADQFGGVEGKKFKYKRLKELLLDIQRFTMHEQHLHIKETLKIWKGDFEQIDDICVMGVEV